MEEKIKLLQMPEDLLTRSVNVGFSGGEKKRNDILQMAVLEPELCILDESDSGLDIDALKIVSPGVNALRDGKRAFIIVTHYQRILDYIKPDYVHVLYQGRIVKSGDFSWSNSWRSRAMAGLPNSSNALQQWHHLFEAQGGPRTRRPVSICSSCCAFGLPTRKHEDWKYTRWMPYLTVALSPMRGPLSALNSVMRWRCRWTPGGWCLSMAAIILS